MKYNLERKEIIVDRNLSELDKLVIDFIKILEKHCEYVIISGYVSILLGRSRATEDIDVFVKKIGKKEFLNLWNDLDKNNFECINGTKANEMFDYLEKGSAIRFAIKGTIIPNFEVKFPKNRLDEGTFNDFLIALLPNAKLKISSLERHIAFKRHFLKSDKDIEDAMHVEELFGDKLDHDKINKLKKYIDTIK